MLLSSAMGDLCATPKSYTPICAQAMIWHANYWYATDLANLSEPLWKTGPGVDSSSLTCSMGSKDGIIPHAITECGWAFQLASLSPSIARAASRMVRRFLRAWICKAR
jgi:hypothetical protein